MYFKNGAFYFIYYRSKALARVGHRSRDNDSQPPQAEESYPITLPGPIVNFFPLPSTRTQSRCVN